jgi:glycine/D-amino acid oxidase-like deaminating enzyme
VPVLQYAKKRCDLACGGGNFENTLVVRAVKGVGVVYLTPAAYDWTVELTEPVPDVIEEIGWTGGECITDGRTLLHYFRTTPDDRILLGWGGGRLAYGSRLDGRVEVDPEIAAVTHAALLRLFPALAGRSITHAWGGPIDVSPSHIPQIGTLPGAPVHFAFGFTGNGVGPSQMAARALVLWREAEQQWKRQVLFRTGALWMCADDDAYVRRSIEPMKAVGLRIEQLSPDDAARRYPQMSFRGVRTVFFEAEAGYIAARAACELVRETFVREGGE